MFKVQLIKMSDKVINDKNNNQDLKFVVLKLLEIDKKTGVPTGEMQDKYLREGSELLSKVNFEFASYYEVDLSFSGKIIDIRELDKKEKNN